MYTPNINDYCLWSQRGQSGAAPRFSRGQTQHVGPIWTVRWTWVKLGLNLPQLKRSQRLRVDFSRGSGGNPQMKPQMWRTIDSWNCWRCCYNIIIYVVNNQWLFKSSKLNIFINRIYLKYIYIFSKDFSFGTSLVQELTQFADPAD